ncbi:unnamed protein product [Mytilus edulis]|uniref:Histidine N-acetyltransferase C-terminal domain-containing protein n=1 Tax=Mytilus edulis TaxID=6550 RepID=A0A8S3SWL1_MYTED|nr:unnamed protein product [Mytilus edulis]
MFRTSLSRWTSNYLGFLPNRLFHSGIRNNLALESSNYKVNESHGLYGDSTVNIRKATLSDYNTVIAIPNQTNTTDHLVDRYCSFISRKTNTGYVANLDGKDVGFLLTHLIDDGSTLVLDKLRVEEGSDNKKIKKTVYEHIKQTQDPMIKTASINFDPKMTDTHALEEYSVKDWNLVTVKTKETFNTKITDLHEKLKKHSIQLKSSKRLFGRDVTKIISYPESHQHLFKDERLLKSDILYKPVASNIDLVMDKRTLVIGSNMTSSPAVLMSFGTYSYTTAGLHYNLSFHGNMNECVDEHLFIHMISLLNRGNKNVTFEIYVDDAKDMLTVQEILQIYSFQKNKVDNRNNVEWYEKCLC